MEKLENLRNKLNALTENINQLTSEEVVKISQELDELIVEAQLKKAL